MRVFRITTAYDRYLSKFYGARAGLARADYSIQRAALDHDAFGWADFWENALALHGVEVGSAILNARALQSAWAREHLARATNWSLGEIALQQVRRFAPEVVLVEDVCAISDAWLEELRSTCPSVRAIVAFCGANYGGMENLKRYNAVLSNIPDFVARFRAHGIPSALVRHAFEPRILERIGPAGGKRYNFTFVGQVALGKAEHHGRLQILKALSRHHRLDIFCQLGDPVSLYQQAKQFGAVAWYGTLQGLVRLGVPKGVLDSVPLLRRPFYWGGAPKCDFFHRYALRRLHPSVYGLEMFRTLRDSLVTLNSHIDLAGDSASNMRLFEATGVGTCLLTDWKSDLKELFEPDREVVVYRSAGECIEKATWLLRNPCKAQEIGIAGQRRALKEHVFSARAPQLVEIFSRVVRGLSIR